MNRGKYLVDSDGGFNVIVFSVPFNCILTNPLFFESCMEPASNGNGLVQLVQCNILKPSSNTGLGPTLVCV